MKTKHLGAGLIAGAALTLLTSAAVAGIASTKHNLGSSGTGTNTFDGTNEICVFCHTPHGADSSASVPLWNRVLDATPGTTYTTYDALGTTTLDGEVLDVGSVSIACLSCHDGTQAMNTVINAPGSGTTGDAAWLAGVWSGPALGATPNGSLNYATASIVNLTQDLRNDHPIGIEYGGGGCLNTAAGTTCTPTGDADFHDATRPSAAGTGAVQWFVDTDGGGTRDKNDMILYSRGFAAGDGPSVECASCHDPHTETATFLRTANAGSAVCLACHDK